MLLICWRFLHQFVLCKQRKSLGVLKINLERLCCYAAINKSFDIISITDDNFIITNVNIIYFEEQVVANFLQWR